MVDGDIYSHGDAVEFFGARRAGRPDPVCSRSAPAR